MAQPSGIGKLNWRDAGRGALLAAFTALATGVYQAIDKEGFAFTWIIFKPILLSAGSAFVGYIIKNLLTNNSGQLLASDKDKVLVAKDQVK